MALDMLLGGRESTESWKELIRGLTKRGLRVPRLAMIDGNLGLHIAMREV